MPIKKTDKERTPIGRFVRELRRLHGDLTQKDFQEKVLGFRTRQQYVNKVENGIVTEDLDRDFLVSLATVSKQPLEKILEIVAADTDFDAKGPDGEFKLVFGHCIWAAPIALAALKGLTGPFKVGSFFAPTKGEELQRERPAAASGVTTRERVGQLDQETPPDPKPALDTIKWVDQLKPFDRKTPVPGPTHKDSVKSISAVGALDLLDRGEIEVAAVPGHVVHGRPGLVRVAALVDSASGCVLVRDKSTLEELFGSDQGELSTEDTDQGESSPEDTDQGESSPEDNISSKGNRPIFADEFAVAVANTKGLRIAVEPGTITYFLLSDGCKHGFQNFAATCEQKYVKEATEKANSSKVKPGTPKWVKKYKEAEKQITSHRPKNPAQMLASISSQEWKTGDFAKATTSKATLTWQPQASWMQRLMDMKCEQIYFPFGADGRPEHITFELVVREETATAMDPKSKAVREALIDLIYTLADCAELLNNLDSTGAPKSPSDVGLLASYFDLDEDEPPESQAIVRHVTVLKALGAVRFTAYVRCDVIRSKAFRLA